MRARHCIAVLAIACLATGCDKPVSDRTQTHEDPEYEAWKKRFTAFKERNLPKVGTVVTASGVLQSGKPGMFLPFDDGEVYIYSRKDADIPKDNELARRYLGRHITVRGTLQHFESPFPDTDADLAVQVPMEHFFFDVARITVTEGEPH
jgi:hypothetical protein